VGSSHQNVKQLLLKLERAGFIRFILDEKDRRKQRIIKTDKAKEFDKAYDEPSAQFMSKFFENVDPEKLRITVETLLLLENNLKQM